MSIVRTVFNNWFSIDGTTAVDLGDNAPAGFKRDTSLTGWAVVTEAGEKNTVARVSSRKAASDKARKFVGRKMDPEVKAIVGKAMGKVAQRIIYKDQFGFKWRSEKSAHGPELLKEAFDGHTHAVLRDNRISGPRRNLSGAGDEHRHMILPFGTQTEPGGLDRHTHGIV